MWDAMFMGIRRMGRDESMIEYALKVLLQVLINFSMVRIFRYPKNLCVIFEPLHILFLLHLTPFTCN